MTKKAGPGPTPEVTAADIGKLADQLGLSDERERRRLASTLPGLVSSFYMLEKDRTERVTKRQRLGQIAAFKKAATEIAGELAQDGWARAKMISHEVDVALSDKSLSSDEQTQRINGAERTVKEEIRLVAAGIDKLMRRMEQIEILQEHGVHGRVNAKPWLAERCLDFWEKHLRDAKVNQVKFTAGVFGLARVTMSDEQVRTLLQHARDKRAENLRKVRAESQRQEPAPGAAITNPAAWCQAVVVALTALCDDEEWARERVKCRWPKDKNVDVGSDPNQAAADEYTRMLDEHGGDADAG